MKMSGADPKTWEGSSGWKTPENSLTVDYSSSLQASELGGSPFLFGASSFLEMNNAVEDSANKAADTLQQAALNCPCLPSWWHLIKKPEWKSE